MAFLKQTLILALVSTLEGCGVCNEHRKSNCEAKEECKWDLKVKWCVAKNPSGNDYELDVRYVPANGYDFMKLLSNVDYNCGLSPACGTREHLNSPEMCQGYCRMEAECQFWTYMTWDSGHHECYLQKGNAIRNRLREEGSGRISGTKFCGEPDENYTPAPSVFDKGGYYEQLVAFATDILEYNFPYLSPLTGLIKRGSTFVGVVLRWFKTWFYRRRLQTRFLETPPEHEISIALTEFYDEVEQNVPALEAKAANQETRFNLELVVSQIIASTKMVEDEKSVFKALDDLSKVMRLEAVKLSEAISTDESSEFKSEVLQVLPFLTKMERFAEYAHGFEDSEQMK